MVAFASFLSSISSTPSSFRLPPTAVLCPYRRKKGWINPHGRNLCFEPFARQDRRLRIPMVHFVKIEIRITIPTIAIRTRRNPPIDKKVKKPLQNPFFFLGLVVTSVAFSVLIVVSAVSIFSPFWMVKIIDEFCGLRLNKLFPLQFFFLSPPSLVNFSNKKGRCPKICIFG